MITLTLTDQIPSGKTSGVKEGYRKDGSKYRYPNKRFVAWRNVASTEIMTQRMKWPLVVKGALPLKGDLILTVNYREIMPVPANGVRDISGMTEALQHLLEHMEIIETDGQIKGLTWAYPWRTEGPCVELIVDAG